jgi:hypothetical protein
MLPLLSYILSAHRESACFAGITANAVEMYCRSTLTCYTLAYSVLVDTNFLSHTVHHKLPLLPTLMDTLYATCTPIITSCVMAELEKLGPKYRIALQIARDERWERLQCDHKGTYAG